MALTVRAVLDRLLDGRHDAIMEDGVIVMCAAYLARLEDEVAAEFSTVPLRAGDGHLFYRGLPIHVVDEPWVLYVAGWAR